MVLDGGEQVRVGLVGAVELLEAVADAHADRERVRRQIENGDVAPLRGKPVDPATASKVGEMARASIKYPEGGIKLGDLVASEPTVWAAWGVVPM